MQPGWPHCEFDGSNVIFISFVEQIARVYAIEYVIYMLFGHVVYMLSGYAIYMLSGHAISICYQICMQLMSHNCYQVCYIPAIRYAIKLC